MSLLLASKSATRRSMLEVSGIEFEVCDALLEENVAKQELREQRLPPSAIARGLAEQKALSVPNAGSSFVIGADQTLELECGTMLDKSRSRAEASEQLKMLRGKIHRLHAAAAIIEDGAVVWEGLETVSLHMRSFSDGFLEEYLEREYDAVRFNLGNYRIEGLGVQLFSGIEGSHFAILGLPLLPLLDYLRGRGVVRS